MSIEQISQRRELAHQREEIERQNLQINNLQNQITALNATTVKQTSSSSSSQILSSYNSYNSGPPSPSAERYTPVNGLESPRNALYSSSPVERSAPYSSGLVMPTLPPRRRVTVSELQQAPRHSTAAQHFSLYTTPNPSVPPQAAHTTPAGGVSSAQDHIRHSRSASSAPSGPFHALAAASGVLLPENEVSLTALADLEPD